MSKDKKVDKSKVKAKAKTATKPAAKSSGGNSVTKYVRARLAAGVTNVDTILDGIHKEFPKAKATAGYVRHIARHIVGKPLAASSGRKAADAKKAKGKTDAKAKGKASAKGDAKAKPAPKADKPSDGDTAQTPS